VPLEALGHRAHRVPPSAEAKSAVLVLVTAGPGLPGLVGRDRGNARGRCRRGTIRIRRSAGSGDHPRRVEEVHLPVVVVQEWSRDPVAGPAVGGGRATHHSQRERAAAQDAALLQFHVRLRLGCLGFALGPHFLSVRTIQGVASERDPSAQLCACGFSSTASLGEADEGATVARWSALLATCFISGSVKRLALLKDSMRASFRCVNCRNSQAFSEVAVPRASSPEPRHDASNPWRISRGQPGDR
jgi:hypothetical protein